MNKNFKIWLEAIRLRSLPVSVSGVLMAIGIAVWQNHFKWIPAVLCLVFAVLAQVVSNFANEYYDYLRGADKKGRVRPSYRNAVSPRATSSPRRCATSPTSPLLWHASWAAA